MLSRNLSAFELSSAWATAGRYAMVSGSRENSGFVFRAYENDLYCPAIRLPPSPKRSLDGIGIGRLLSTLHDDHFDAVSAVLLRAIQGLVGMLNNFLNPQFGVGFGGANANSD